MCNQTLARLPEGDLYVEDWTKTTCQACLIRGMQVYTDVASSYGLFNQYAKLVLQWRGR